MRGSYKLFGQCFTGIAITLKHSTALWIVFLFNKQLVKHPDSNKVYYI